MHGRPHYGTSVNFSRMWCFALDQSLFLSTALIHTQWWIRSRLSEKRNQVAAQEFYLVVCSKLVKKPWSIYFLSQKEDYNVVGWKWRQKVSPECRRKTQHFLVAKLWKKQDLNQNVSLENIEYNLKGIQMSSHRVLQLRDTRPCSRDEAPTGPLAVKSTHW